MTYEETLEWIHDHLVFGIKPGLKRMLWVLGQLGNPQKMSRECISLELTEKVPRSIIYNTSLRQLVMKWGPLPLLILWISKNVLA